MTYASVRAAIVIPALNESATIGLVVAAVAPHGTPVVVDDGSSDATGSEARANGAVVVRHESNRGYDAALQSGFREADRLGAEFVVTFDADGQHSPAVLREFLAPLETGAADLVLGVRPRAARFAEHVFNGYVRLRFGVPDILCGLKGYRMSLYHRHGRFDGTRSIGTELAIAGLNMQVPYRLVPVPIFERKAGTARLGSTLRANLRILSALMRAVVGKR